MAYCVALLRVPPCVSWRAEGAQCVVRAFARAGSAGPGVILLPRSRLSGLLGSSEVTEQLPAPLGSCFPS